MQLTYLASPYTHADPAVRESRFQAVCKKAAEMMLRGRVVFCPVAHSHPVSEAMPDGFAVDGALWQTQDAPYLEFCTELAVLMLDGWNVSKGVAHEIARAKERGIPVEYLRP